MSVPETVSVSPFFFFPLFVTLTMTRGLMFAAMMTRMMFDNESFVDPCYSDLGYEQSKEERAVPWMRPETQDLEPSVC